MAVSEPIISRYVFLLLVTILAILFVRPSSKKEGEKTTSTSSGSNKYAARVMAVVTRGCTILSSFVLLLVFLVGFDSMYVLL